MKKVILGLVCFLLIISCGLENPESITIKGNPGLYVPLGSPFANLEPEERLEYLLSPQKIEDMMNEDSDPNINIHEVDSATVTGTLGSAYNNKLTYLVEYQLANITLNIDKYMKEAMEDVDITQKEIPPFPTLPSQQEFFIGGDGKLYNSHDAVKDNPFLSIPLDDMMEFVEWVTIAPGGKVGLKFLQYNRLFASMLQISIPQLNIDYIKGNEENKEMLYVRTVNPYEETFYPRTLLQPDSKLRIYAKITGDCPATTIEPVIVFEWNKAQINTTEKINKSYNIKNSLGDFLGDAVSFDRVLGYVYFYGVANNEDKIYMTAAFNKETQYRDLKVIKDLPYTVDPKTEIVTGKLNPSSIINSDMTPKDDPLNLTSIFEGDGTALDVDIDIPTWNIKNDDDLNDTITCILGILIPMDLRVSGEVDINAPREIKDKYVPLNLKGLSDGEERTDDIFGRKDSGDNIINDIDYVKITLTNTDDITIIDKKKLAVLIKNIEGDYKLLRFYNPDAPDNPDVTLKLDKDFIRYPFNPKFTILLEKDINKTNGAYETYGSFSILRPGPDKASKFDFKLSVTAKTALNYTLKF